MTSGLISRIYLIIYNGISMVAWASLLANAFMALSNGIAYSQLYSVIGDSLRWVQTMALLEVLHSAIGIVKSPLMTSVMQVASRIWIVWMTLFYTTSESVKTHWTFGIMLFAWGITEVIRYSYYIIGQLNVSPPKWYQWIRYSSFLPLYPIGVFCECSLIYSSLGASKKIGGNALYWALIGTLFVVYPIGLYTLYTYMLRQRRKVLGGRVSNRKKFK